MLAMNDYFNSVVDGVAKDYGANLSNLPIALILGIVCYFASKFLLKIFSRINEKAHIDINLYKLFEKIISVMLFFISVMIVAGTLGINTTSLIAAFSVVGLAISLSVQNLISNVANAINIYVIKPFKLGDYVLIDGVEGNVEEIGFMFTKVKTYKNEIVYMPNSTVGNSIITNYSADPYRRIEFTVGASYENKIEDVKNALIEAINEEPLVIKSEPILVFISDYASSSINYTLRVYTENKNFLNCKTSLIERIKPAFDRNNISIPYNQLDVFVKNQ